MPEQFQSAKKDVIKQTPAQIFYSLERCDNDITDLLDELDDLNRSLNDTTLSKAERREITSKRNELKHKLELKHAEQRRLSKEWQAVDPTIRSNYESGD